MKMLSLEIGLPRLIESEEEWACEIRLQRLVWFVRKEFDRIIFVRYLSCEDERKQHYIPRFLQFVTFVSY